MADSVTTPSRRGITIPEVLVILACLLAILGVLLPAAGQLSRTTMQAGSKKNLRILHEAMTCYAADWSDRQFTAVPDDLGAAGGSCNQYAQQFGCYPPM